MPRSVVILISALLVSVVIMGPASASVLLISDTFTAANGSPIDGRTPSPTDLPGGTYQASTANAFWEVEGGHVEILSNAAVIGPDAADGIDISAFATDQGMLISADVSHFGTPTAGAGAALGFWSAVPNGVGDNGLKNFVGVALGFNSTNGHAQLNLLDGGFGVITDSIDLRPTLDVGSPHLLAYWIDRTSGAITSLTLDGIPYSFSTTAFTTANTQFAVIGGNTNVGDAGVFDNFELSVPEPASMGVLLVGGSALLGMRRRR